MLFVSSRGQSYKYVYGSLEGGSGCGSGEAQSVSDTKFQKIDVMSYRHVMTVLEPLELCSKWAFLG